MCSEAGGSLLVVSQFTLYADCRRGAGPVSTRRLRRSRPQALYNYFLESARRGPVPVQAGIFQAMMQVHIRERRSCHNPARFGGTKQEMIETYGYARAGFLGNPSDGYFGKTLSFAFANFRARVLLYPSGRLEIKPSKADLPVFESLDDLYRITRWRGYYGGIRIIQALIVRLIEYCKQAGIELPDRNFTLEYESNIPQRLGLGGSSAIITASLRALCQYYELEIPLPVQANLVLETETRELNVPAGLQDRVIQAYQGLVYMDFSRDLMDARGYGEYERLDPALLPQCLCGLPDVVERRNRSLPQQPARAMAARRSGGGRMRCAPGRAMRRRARPVCWSGDYGGSAN